MPYTHKKVGDQYCVYKKDGGAKVGCTDGNKQALQKYLAALHINANEQKQSSVFSQIREFIYKEDQQVFNTDKPIGLNVFAKNKDASDAIIGSGLEDKDKQDDVVAGGAATVAVKDLKPAQTELIKEKAFGMAIGFLMKGKWDGIDLGSIISNDNYIMDGHHRWAAVTLIDPTATIKATAIDLPGGPLVSTLNAATVGKLGITNGNKGTGNIQEFTTDKLLAVIDSAMTAGIKGGDFPLTSDQIKQALGKVPGANGDPEKGKQIMAKNANALSKKIMPLAPPRVQMPVIDKSKVKAIQIMIAKGMLDIKPPFSATVDALLPLKESQTIHRQLTLENNMNKKAHKQLAAIKEWLITGKTLNELTFTSAGIPELIQLIYDKQKELVPKLGFKSMTDILSFIMYGDQEEQAELVSKLQALKVPGSEKLIKEELAIRQLIRKIIREGEAGLPKEPEEEKPEPVVDEPGLDPELVELTNLYIKKLKNAQATVDLTATSEILSSVLDSFGYSSNDKLTVLQAVKSISIQ